MATYEDFLSRVLPSVPGCPELMVKTVVQDSVIEFCEKSRLWMYALDPMTAVVGQADYDFDAPTGGRLIAIEKLWFKGRPLAPQAPGEVWNAREFNTLYSPGENFKGVPQYFYQKDVTEQTFSVFPIPDQTYQNALTMTASFKPTRAAASIPDFLFEDWAEAITSGALRRLLMQSQKAYSDIRLAEAHALLFERSANNARLRARRGNTNADLQVRLPRAI